MKTITEVLREFKNHTDYEKTDLISSYAEKYCKEDKVKEKILKDMEDVMEADGIIKSVEEHLMEPQSISTGIHFVHKETRVIII